MLKIKCLHVDEVLPQVAVMTKPAVVTIAEHSHTSSNDVSTVAPRISTEKLMPVVSAGRCSPVDQAGLWDGTDQSVLSRSESEYSGINSVGPVGPYITFDQVQPVDTEPSGDENSSWVPGYSPTSMTSSVGGEARPMSTVAVLTLFTDGNGRVTAQLHRNVGPVPTDCAVATGGTVAVSRARGHD